MGGDKVLIVLRFELSGLLVRTICYLGKGESGIAQAIARDEWAIPECGKGVEGIQFSFQGLGRVVNLPARVVTQA